MTYIISVPIFNAVALNRGRVFVSYGRPDRSRTSTRQRAGFNPIQIHESYPNHGTVPAYRLPQSISSLSRKRKKFLSRCLNAMSAAWISMWPASQFGLAANKANCDAIRPLTEIHRWMMSQYLHDYVTFTRGLKSFANWLRYSAATDHQLWPKPSVEFNFPFFRNGELELSRVFRGSLSRFSYRRVLRLCRFARALPPGDRKSCNRALRDHQATLSIERITDSATIVACGRVMEARLSSIKIEPHEFCARKINLSNSASFNNSRASGGAMFELKNELWNRHPEFATKDPWDPEYICWMRYEGRPEEWKIIHDHTHRSCVESMDSILLSGLPKHRVVAIPDRGGFKTRVVTAGESVIQTLAHNVRKVLYSKVLERTAVRFALRTGGVKEFFDSLPPLGQFKRTWGDIVLLSSDLKSATDLFPFDIVQEHNRVLENVFRIDPSEPNWRAWKILSGPQSLHYDFGCGEKVTTVSRSGNLMGTAPSWFHLCMFNLNCFELAWQVWYKHGWDRHFRDLRRIRLRHELDFNLLTSQIRSLLDGLEFKTLRIGHFSQSTIVIGDDLGSICPFGVCVVYEILLNLLHGRTSPGKHYVQDINPGAFMLIAEETAVVQGDRLMFLKTDSVRGFTAPMDYISQIQCSNPRKSESVVPSAHWSLIGPTLSSLVESAREETAMPLLQFARLLLTEERLMLVRAGLPVYLPTAVGGLGWPHPRGEQYSFKIMPIRHFRVLSLLRGFREDFFTYHLQYARMRALWRGDAVLNLFGPMAEMFLDYLRSRLRVSKDTHGVLTPLTLESPVGLSTPALPSIPFREFLDKIVIGAMAARYLVSGVEYMFGADAVVFVTPGWQDTETSLLRGNSVSVASKKYDVFYEQLSNLRAGRVKSVDHTSVYSLVEEERDYMESFHILWTDEHRSSLEELFFQGSMDLSPRT